MSENKLDSETLRWVADQLEKRAADLWELHSYEVVHELEAQATEMHRLADEQNKL